MSILDALRQVVAALEGLNVPFGSLGVANADPHSWGHRGGRVAAGTGFELAGYPVPGAGLQRELSALVRAGLPPIEAIRAATSTAADLVGAQPRFDSPRAPPRTSSSCRAIPLRGSKTSPPSRTSSVRARCSTRRCCSPARCRREGNNHLPRRKQQTKNRDSARRPWVAEALPICAQGGQAKVTRAQRGTARTGPAADGHRLRAGCGTAWGRRGGRRGSR